MACCGYDVDVVVFIVLRLDFFYETGFVLGAKTDHLYPSLYPLFVHL